MKKVKLDIVRNPSGTINIRKTVKKPSVALKLMVQGLKKQSRRKGFSVEMQTYGNSDEPGVCYGCAATCTIQELSQKDFINGEINTITGRANHLGFNRRELDLFEWTMDHARKGDIYTLFDFFKISDYTTKSSLCPIVWCLYNYNWKKRLPEVELTIAKLEKEGY